MFPQFKFHSISSSIFIYCGKTSHGTFPMLLNIEHTLCYFKIALIYIFISPQIKLNSHWIDLFSFFLCVAIWKGFVCVVFVNDVNVHLIIMNNHFSIRQHKLSLNTKNGMNSHENQHSPHGKWLWYFLNNCESCHFENDHLFTVCAFRI